jgi:hypothetical protein
VKVTGNNVNYCIAIRQVSARCWTCAAAGRAPMRGMHQVRMLQEFAAKMSVPSPAADDSCSLPQNGVCAVKSQATDRLCIELLIAIPRNLPSALCLLVVQHRTLMHV